MSEQDTELAALKAQLDGIEAGTAAAPAEVIVGAPTPETVIEYRVSQGDSLEAIANAHQTTPEAILAANVGTLINDNLIVGQYILLPAGAA